MRIPITKDGYGVILASTLVLIVLGGVASIFTAWAWPAVVIVWVWVVAFFRDPAREIARREDILYAPADGRITEVVELDHHDLIRGPCHRVRIFMSLFSTHINRMPCAASVKSIEFHPGKFVSATRPQSAEVNESNTLILAPQPPFSGPMVLRQIAGMVARTIVCHASVGQAFESGGRFGMVKFGSGSELIIPRQEGLKILVSVGDSVRAGLTEIAKLDTMDR